MHQDRRKCSAGVLESSRGDLARESYVLFRADEDQLCVGISF